MLFRASVITGLVLSFSTLGTAQQAPLPSHLKPGILLLQQKKYPEATRAFEAIVRENPEDGSAWFQLGLARHFAGDLDRAIEAHFLAIHFLPLGSASTSAMYNVACVYGLQSKVDRSLQWLHRARNAGLKNFNQVAADTDLTSLREDPRFVAFKNNGSLRTPSDSSATVTSVTAVMNGSTGGLQLGPDGELYVANFGSDVWRVEPDGTFTVFATGFTKAADCLLDENGNLLQVDYGASKVWSVAPDGVRTDLNVQGLNGPVGIDYGPEGTFYLTNFNLDAILQVNPDGTQRQIASNGLLNGPNGLANAGELGLFVANYKDGGVIQIDPESGAMRFICEVPGGGNGHIEWDGEVFYVTARLGHRVYRVTPEGNVHIVAGSGQQGTQDGGANSSRLSLPNGIVLSEDGKTIYVNDSLAAGGGSVVRRIEIP